MRIKMMTTRIPFKAIRLVAMVLIMTISLNVITSLTIENASGQTSDQDIVVNSSSTTSPASPTPLSSEVLGLSLTKLGVASGSFLRISYDFETNSLSVSEMMGGNDKDTSIGRSSPSQTRQSVNQIPDIDEKSLQQMLTAMDSASLNSFYLPDPLENQNINTIYIMSVEETDGLQTVLWTNASSLEVPKAVRDIAEVIENANLNTQ